ncbi:MAG: phosphomethylpyrimidine synthase ThiC [Bacteroidales bacterium]|nr:phosphomethylpyrimidine synthase ThiC [Bacteroidales bacterium]
MNPVKLKFKGGQLLIGDGYPIIVNCNVGVNHKEKYLNEIRKIDDLFADCNTHPDTMMDLSICSIKQSIAKYIITKYNIPVGIVPAYTVYSKEEGIDKYKLLDNIEKSAEEGIAFMTMHFTADQDIYQIAKKNRNIPTTSRGGGIVLSDKIINKRTDNVYISNIDKIICLAKKYSFVISLGATFRPAGIIDACDEAHIKETLKQIELSKYIQERGVDVIVENVGHIGIDNIINHSKLLREANSPIMPLGPTPIDSAIGYDHIASAIGAAFMGYCNCAHIINAISPSEHLRSGFDIGDMKNGIIAAKIAAQTINVTRFDNSMMVESQIYTKRSENKSCFITPNISCSRCSKICPLKI